MVYWAEVQFGLRVFDVNLPTLQESMRKTV